ncbi:MAG TPA: 50S ribosomal protein L25, partial [Gammaproteobacteria bacterium]|nr:50S ribosomal protein L25 [Gammaproteobacteria bacterium]
VVRDMQRHPATEKVAHIDFLRIDANVSINVSVPLHFINEESCVGVKISGGTLTHNLTEVEVSCLPDALPEF